MSRNEIDRDECPAEILEYFLLKRVELPVLLNRYDLYYIDRLYEDKIFKMHYPDHSHSGRFDFALAEWVYQSIDYWRYRDINKARNGILIGTEEIIQVCFKNVIALLENPHCAQIRISEEYAVEIHLALAEYERNPVPDEKPVLEL